VQGLVIKSVLFLMSIVCIGRSGVCSFISSRILKTKEAAGLSIATKVLLKRCCVECHENCKTKSLLLLMCAVIAIALNEHFKRLPLAEY